MTQEISSAASGEEASPKTSSPWLRLIPGSVLLFVLWLLLTGSLAASELFVGLIVSVSVAWLARRQLALLDDFKLTAAMPWYLLLYLLNFFYALIRANLDMARRVLSPELPINPAVVEVRTGLRSRLGRLVLANSITLTPGTLTVDVLEDRLRIHWVDSTPGTDLETATQAIAADFEKHLKEVFQ